MVLVLERRLEEFSRSLENRLLSVEDQIIGACDTNKKNETCLIMVFVSICWKIGWLIWNIKSLKNMLLLVSNQSNLLIKTSNVILVMVQLLMTIMAVFTKELKLLIITSLWVKIISKYSMRFFFNIRNYSPKVINIQRREAELNIVFRMNNFDIKGR